MGPAAAEQSKQVNGRRRKLHERGCRQRQIGLKERGAKRIIIIHSFPSKTSKRETQP